MREKMIDRIEKMLRITHGDNRGATEAEVKNALAMAQRLMRKHNIEMAEVLKKEDDRPQVGDIIQRTVRSKGNVVNFESAILHAICLMTNTAFFIERIGSKHNLVVYGLKDDVDIAEMMFTEVIFLMRAMARLEVNGKWCKRHKDWCLGFAHGVHHQAKAEAEKPVPNESGSTTIIVLKDQLLKEYADTQLSLGKARKRTQKVGQEFFDGKEKGKAFQFPKGKIS